MLGIPLIVMGFIISFLGLGLEGFENPSAAKYIKRRFILTGLSLSLIGLIITIFTL
jgi:hypothetical protein